LTASAQTKADRASEIKASQTTSASMGDMKVRVFGDTAVVTGSDDETTMEDGKKSSNLPRSERRLEGEAGYA